MIYITHPEDCCGCRSCVSVCPLGCIKMEEDNEGFSYPKADVSRCINCGKCLSVCPVLSPPPQNDKRQPLAFGAVNTQENIRARSSSGGIFTAMALETIGRGGAVFGAAFDEKLNVRHVCARSPEELSPICGSKYVQSDIGNAYIEARAALDSGLPVLFSGTPCQIAGLRSFLGGKEQGLICVDLICHGVPSPKSWNRYLDELGAEYGCHVAGVNFRQKSAGWKRYQLELRFQDGRTLNLPHVTDPFFKLFLSDICLRPSCYNCRFRGDGRSSDLTIADFWGVEHLSPQLDDDRGTSLVLVNTNKGARLWSSLRKSLVYSEVDMYSAFSFNPSALRSPAMPGNRSKYFQMMDHLTTAKAAKRFAYKPMYRKVFGRMRSVMSKVVGGKSLNIRP